MTTVLVVDDSAVDRRLVSDLLSKGTGWTIASAKSGQAALTKIRESTPDLVVTDLQMPGMNGLELVRALHQTHPELPVILITAHGSEMLASEALAAGAASYVPKSQLGIKLADVAREVLSLVRAEHHAEELLGWLGGSSFELDNNPALVEPLVDLVQQMLVGMRFGDFGERLRIGVALKEALLNALFHGNLELTPDEALTARDKLAQAEDFELLDKRRLEEPYASRKIFVNAKVTLEEARFVVRDEGPGFDVATMPDVSDPQAMERESGRGLPLMRNFMDEVNYNDPGNEVTLIRRRVEDPNSGRAD